MPKKHKLLMIGYGNPGRQDDGLGPAFVEKCQQELADSAHLEILFQTNYQLTVEDALDISRVDSVVFVDASLVGALPFHMAQIDCTEEATIGSHSVSPQAAITLCHTLYGKKPYAFLLGIKGVEFDQFEEKLSTNAEANLNAAFDFFGNWLATQPKATQSSELQHA